MSAPPVLFIHRTRSALRRTGSSTCHPCRRRSGRAGGALTGINSLDIVNIEGLTDIGSTSAYGVRGTNGIVPITTRRD